MVREDLEMENLGDREKLLRRSLDGSFSDSDNEEDDIIVHSTSDGPSNEDRQLLNEEEDREKLITKKRKILIGSKHARKKSIESYMEDGNVSALDILRRSKVKHTPDRRL
jgi:hypothetical protein